MNPSHGIRNDPFCTLFGSKNRSKTNLDFWLILGTKMGPTNDFGSKNRYPRLPEWCPRAAHSHPKWFQTHFQNRPMFKSRIRISRVIPKKIFVKEVLRRCSAQRAQSAAAPPRCCLGVQDTLSISKAKYQSLREKKDPPERRLCRRPLSWSVPFFVQKSTLLFDRFLEPKLAQFWSHLWTKILPKPIPNLSDFLIVFWMWL